MTNPTHTNDFPVHWQQPEDEQMFWSFYGSYMPEPFTCLERDLISQCFAPNFNKSYQYYQIGQSRVRFFNGYYYEAISGTPSLSATEVESLRAEKITPLARAHVTQGLTADHTFADWEAAWGAEVKHCLAAMAAFDLNQPLPQLVAYVDQAQHHYARICELHAMQFPLNVLIVHEFEQFYQDLFGELPPHGLLHKAETHAIRGNRQLWDLSRQILRQPAFAELFSTATTATLLLQLSQSEAGQAILAGLQDYLAQHGKQGDAILHICQPTWAEDPTPVILNLKTYLSHGQRDFVAELNEKRAEHEQAVAAAHTQLATYPQPVVAQFEALLQNAQKATYLLDEHTYWMELAPGYYLRHLFLAIGRALQAAGCLAQSDDVFHLYLAELRHLGENPTAQHALIDERKATLAYCKQLTPPPFIGAFPTDPPPVNPILDILYAPYATMGGPTEDPQLLTGCAASPGVVVGPVKILRSVREVDRLAPGDILVTTMTTPIWTPVFAHAAGIITDSGGMLSHPAIVAREMGIPAVIGTGQATLILQEGQQVELNGSTGQVKIL